MPFLSEVEHELVNSVLHEKICEESDAISCMDWADDTTMLQHVRDIQEIETLRRKLWKKYNDDAESAY